MLSGIPMVYMEGKDTMDFQSAGMCEILAKSNDRQVQLKPGKEIGVGLRNVVQDTDYNLYYFDTLKGNWIEKDKNIPLVKVKNIPIKPINVAQVPDNILVTIDIADYNMRPHYKMWHESKFKLYGNQSKFEADTNVWWYDMSVTSTVNKDLFKLTFSGVRNNLDQVTRKYVVQPTIDSENFEAEMNTFYNNMRLYVAEIEAQEKLLKENALLAEQIEVDWKREKALDSIRLEKQKVSDSVRLVEQNIIDSLYVVEQAAALQFENVRVEVMRSFQIKQMGIYNCDRFYSRQILATKLISPKVKGVISHFDHVFLINKYDNAVLNRVPFNDNHYSIKFDNKPYVFVGILRGVIYHAYIKLSDSGNYRYEINMEEITADEFKSMMS